jgi:hypothetical protein
MSKGVGSYGSAKRTHHIATFPDDLMHVIFSRLEFKDKINAGQVCKQWDQLLKAGTDDARHWIVDYDVDTLVSSTAFKATTKLSHAKQSGTLVERCVPVGATWIPPGPSGIHPSCFGSTSPFCRLILTVLALVRNVRIPMCHSSGMQMSHSMTFIAHASLPYIFVSLCQCGVLSQGVNAIELVIRSVTGDSRGALTHAELCCRLCL